MQLFLPILKKKKNKYFLNNFFFFSIQGVSDEERDTDRAGFFNSIFANFLFFRSIFFATQRVATAMHRSPVANGATLAASSGPLHAPQEIFPPGIARASSVVLVFAENGYSRERERARVCVLATPARRAGATGVCMQRAPSERLVGGYSRV